MVLLRACSRWEGILFVDPDDLVVSNPRISIFQILLPTVMHHHPTLPWFSHNLWDTPSLTGITSICLCSECYRSLDVVGLGFKCLSVFVHRPWFRVIVSGDLSYVLLRFERGSFMPSCENSSVAIFVGILNIIHIWTWYSSNHDNQAKESWRWESSGLNMAFFRSNNKIFESKHTLMDYGSTYQSCPSTET